MKLHPFHFAAVALLSICNIQAAPVVIQNFSFESPGLDDGGWTPSNLVDGFTFSGSGMENPTNAQFAGTTGGNLPAPALGAQYAFLNGGDTNFMYQNVGALLPNTTYTLTVALGSRLDQDNGSIVMSFRNGITNVDGTLLGSSAPYAIPVAFSGTFTDFSYSITTGAVVTGDLTIVIQNAPGTGNPNVVDNIRLDATAVPEPGTVMLLMGGLTVALGAYAMQRRSQR